ncbi:hypothetical protein QCA50_002527 [Cerrena zonata]|uniref:F-box domain-containing protein n=1 Tax=Cerrena zonata TaxID=2478898 RepID=A0AAW0GRR2_9APHY
MPKPSSTYCTLADLPFELYSDILDYVPKHELQKAAVGLIGAIPRSPVPRHYALRCVRLTYPGQIIRLYQRLRKEKEIVYLIETFLLETWNADADSVVNVMKLLVKFGRTKEVRMFIGLNFTPEHVLEIFQTPWADLKLLSLRFRPYVQRATYYQFLAGAYFDSTLEALSKWPGEDCLLPKLSIIQDPIDSSLAPSNKFAQPIVFFSLDPIQKLAVSQLAYEVKHLRIRIPARRFTKFLHSAPGSYPSLNLLDISTSHVAEADVEAILGRFNKLEHLIMDGCGVISQRATMEDEERRALWVGLGKTMAIAGKKAARQREKKLKQWFEMIDLQHAMERSKIQENDQPVQPARPAPRRRANKGRKGLATSTISLRKTPPPRDSPRDYQGGTNSSITVPTRRIRIVAPQPRLLTVSLNAPVHRGTSNLSTVCDSIRADFEQGWAEGLSILARDRHQVKQSRQLGVQVFMFRHSCDSEDEDDEIDTETGLQGLVEVQSEQDLSLREDSCPVLCLAGTGQMDAEGHTEGCGHSMGWRVWDDEL